MSLYRERDDIVLFIPGSIHSNWAGTRIRYVEHYEYRFKPEDVRITETEESITIEGDAIKTVYHAENIANEGNPQYRQPEKDLSFTFGKNQIMIDL